MLNELLDRIIRKDYEQYEEPNYQEKAPFNKYSITLLILLIIQVIGEIYSLFIIGINDSLMLIAIIDLTILILSIIGISQRKKYGSQIIIRYTTFVLILSFIIVILIPQIFSDPFYSLLFFISYILDIFTIYCGLEEYKRVQEFYPSENEDYQYCPKCGILLEESLIFCANCGVDLTLNPPV